ncbi:MAG: ABC transporter ATP-binding protein [Tenericutes bacterium GWC2_34_14]|nr:MAG: ABC transporter ATP-binding protein [Tenericutes bacterium GWC2_34_14]OHE34042.1 MAG: ABC transporter ATP-binding protein [Tenericutes bacterium GWE2_34_108]OHE35371.1 MAG: ABC transporter ATP-binding protein [Tenericutes bacterium GWF1_35_14]OHE38482.1 MAG: ABC transporter ATP-binding protein [Tenericutes bacterium GWF2_35_184]OHE43124.1 MAG: ABC transporter ATP-binding protein [Tenericutes bacterium RIFOXYA2_FULL_36_32]OHE45542.1 MAG: ABC transporter ATP-binding protein [Tenericutes 
MHQDDQDIQYKVQISTWKKIVSIIFKSKKHLILLIIYSGLLASLDVLIPMFNRYAIDTFFVGGDYTTWPYYVAANLGLALAFGLVVWGFIYEAGIIEAEVSYELRRQAFENLQRLSYAYFDKTPQGWVMARMTSDTRKLSLIISWGLVDFVWAGLQMIMILIVLYLTFIKLAIIMTIVLPVMLLIAYVFTKLILKQHRIARKFNSQLTAQYSEGFLGAKTTKSLSIEDSNYDEFSLTANNLRRSSIKAVISSAIFSSVVLILAYVAVTTTMVQGSIYVLGSVLSLGTLQMFLFYTTNFFEPVMAISRTLSDLQNAQASAERIVGLIETKPELYDKEEVIQKYGDLFNDIKENWEPLKGDVEFKDLTFYYKEDETILENFNLKVKAGMSVALVGHTGSGKTTLVNLLSRFYEPKQGSILIDGVDYRERSIHWLHARLGYVLQAPHLFSTTVMENIRYGRLDATDEEVIYAAKMVGVDTFVQRLDKGYETSVGEGGNLLSVGQKQLISFARAVLADPRILILDEATSSIDSESEEIIQMATHKLLSDRTSFVVAHRLSTIVHSDLIVMLDMGKIIEMGTHEELLNKRGAYFELYKNQFFKEKGKELEAVITE